MSTRSYFTYQQSVIRAIIELQQEQRGSPSSFHTNTIHKKIRDFAQAEEVRLGPHWTKHVARAVAALIAANVLRKQGSSVALSPKGARSLASSRKRYGAYHKLSLFKKSQLLRSVVGTHNAVRPSRIMSQKSISQENVVMSLRASLAKVKDRNKSIGFELENTKKERDDLQLALLDMERSFAPSSRLGNAPAGFPGSFVPPATPRTPEYRPDPTIHSTRGRLPDLSSTPTHSSATIPLPIGPRPTASFTHCRSGSFLNTLSNQFTPSPSPGPVLDGPARNFTAGTDEIRSQDEDEDEASDTFDFPDVEMGDAHDGPEDSHAVGDQADSDMSRGERAQNPASDQALGSTSERAAAPSVPPDSEGFQQPAVENPDHDVLMQKLGSVTQDRDSLQNTAVELRAALQAFTDRFDSLRIEHDLVTQESDALKSQKDACEEARAATQAENSRLSDEIADGMSEITRLTDRVAALSADLFQANSQRDDAQTQLTSTRAQLEETGARLQTTCGQLDAMQAQLDRAQEDLGVVRKALQDSEAQYAMSQERLSFAQMQFRAKSAMLEAANARVDTISAKCGVTSDQLQDSQGQLNAANAQLDALKGDVQRLQGGVRQAAELECRLREEIRDITVKLATSESERDQLTQQSAFREGGFKSQLEEARERIAILEEDLQRARTAWNKAMDMRRDVAKAEEEIQQLLFRQSAQKRDPSFRDSGVSFTT